MEIEFVVDGKRHRVAVEREGEHYQVSVEGHRYLIECSQPSRNTFSLLVGGQSHLVHLIDGGDACLVSVDGDQISLGHAERQENGVSLDYGAVDDEQSVCAPMPGTIVKILVEEGQTVERGQGLVIVEAMKMENEIRSPIQGQVVKVNFAVGDMVYPEHPIVELEPIEKTPTGSELASQTTKA